MSYSPEFVPSQTPNEERSSRKEVLFLIGLAFVSLIDLMMIGYLFVARESLVARLASLEANLAKANEKTNQLGAKLEQTQTRLAIVKGQRDMNPQTTGPSEDAAARARLAENIRREQRVREERLLAQIGQVKQESEAKIGQVSTELGGAKSDIESTRKDLEETKGKLERTLGDLGVMSGLIAHNRTELEELKRRGERNIFDFDLRRSKMAQRVGPIQLTLQKADPKRLRYTMTVYADDKSIEKKDKTVNEPVQFLVGGARTPYEIVVFEVSKDRAAGYLTTPKVVAPEKP